MPMKMRPQSFDPVTVEGYRQKLIRQRRFKPFGCGCGRWLFGCWILVMSVGIVCGLSMLFYLTYPPERINILIVGVDARAEKDTRIARTDSVMVMSVDPQNHRITLFSIPRDVVINSPTFGKLPVFSVVRNAELQSPGSGMRELERSVESTFTIPIDHTVRVNFNGFVEVVNAVGGIQIDVPKHIRDTEYPNPEGGTIIIEFDKGVQEMDGATALIYSRTRHADDDYQRAIRQQQVMQAVFDKLTSLGNAPRLPCVMVAVLDNSESDMHIGNYVEILPALLLYGRSETVETFVLEREWLVADESGTVSPNLEALDEWLDEYLR